MFLIQIRSCLPSNQTKSQIIREIKNQREFEMCLKCKLPRVKPTESFEFFFQNYSRAKTVKCKKDRDFFVAQSIQEL